LFRAYVRAIGYRRDALPIWKKVYRSIEEIQLDLTERVRQYNFERTHSGKYCYGKTPMRTFIDSIPSAKEKLIGYAESDGQSA
jgi:hypothetical protein